MAEQHVDQDALTPYRGSAREKQRQRRRDMSPHEQQESWSATLQRLRSRKRLPADLMCENCGYVPAAKVEPLRAFVAEAGDRPDLDRALNLTNSIHVTEQGKHIPLRCRCELASEADSVEGERLEALEMLAQAKRLEEANFPEHADGEARTLANFKAARGAQENFEDAEAIAAGTGARLRLWMGVTGCGKSHLLEAVGRAMIAAGLTVRFEATGTMLDRMRASQGRHATEELYDLHMWYAGFDVLLLDDLARGRVTTFGDGELVALLDARIRDGKITVLTTNALEPDDFKERGWSPLLISRIFDNNTGSAHQVWNEAEDYRRMG